MAYRVLFENKHSIILDCTDLETLMCQLDADGIDYIDITEEEEK
jgi:hypothetical protein